MELLSSLIVSPRAGQAFYYGVDPFCREPVLDPSLTNSKDKDAVKVKVVYPFYQYGEYEDMIRIMLRIICRGVLSKARCCRKTKRSFESWLMTFPLEEIKLFYGTW